MPRQIDRFVREAMILSDLSHPNIVRFFEVGEAKPHLYLAMELIEGPTADQVLKERGPMQVNVAVRLVCQLLAGLSHAHSRGFVHRDIKPANILLGRTGEKRVVKLADFGLARVFESSRLSGLTMQGETGGTPAFMAPEQVTHYREVKPAADQYAAAATLYNLLTNQYVFDLPAVIPRALVTITTAQPVPLRQRRADIPADLASVIHRALLREPEQRYTDVDAFRKALLPFG
jgi:serine/threonine-protein kinase